MHFENGTYQFLVLLISLSVWKASWSAKKKYAEYDFTVWMITDGFAMFKKSYSVMYEEQERMLWITILEWEFDV